MTENKNMTIEEMIAAGATWGDISTRVRELQREQAERAEKERAEKMAQEQKAKRNEAISIARGRLIVAIADWVIAEGMVEPEGKDGLINDITPIVNGIAEETKAMFVFDSIFKRR